MNLKEALSILTQATAVVQTDRQTHQKIIEALKLVESIVNDKKDKKTNS